MPLDTIDNVIVELDPLIGTLKDKVEYAEKEQAIKQALLELGFTLPIGAGTKVDKRRGYWLLERSKRYCYWVLVSTSADKFRYKAIHLQHRFDNYYRLIRLMDDVFARALEIEEIFDEYAGDATAMPSVVTSGFSSDSLGRDTTYRRR